MNYPFKAKFSATPQQDSEGFTMMDARCVGCAPTDMCPRSGHCDRYESPIRETHGIAAMMVGQHFFDGQPGTYSDPKCYACNYTLTDADKRFVDQHEALHAAALREHGAARLNPEGWREVDGVLLPHIAWGEPQ